LCGTGHNLLLELLEDLKVINRWTDGLRLV
jgi:hypothetical protein